MPLAQFVATTGILYDVEVQDASANVVYARTISELTGSTSHTLEEDLAFATTYWFRVRARVGNDVGSWSNFAQFRTPDAHRRRRRRRRDRRRLRPRGGLPFPVPPQCGASGPDNRIRLRRRNRRPFRRMAGLRGRASVPAAIASRVRSSTPCRGLTRTGR